MAGEREASPKGPERVMKDMGRDAEGLLFITSW